MLDNESKFEKGLRINFQKVVNLPFIDLASQLALTKASFFELRSTATTHLELIRVGVTILTRNRLLLAAL
jgi:hypothetical protein